MSLRLKLAPCSRTRSLRPRTLCLLKRLGVSSSRPRRPSTATFLSPPAFRMLMRTARFATSWASTAKRAYFRTPSARSDVPCTRFAARAACLMCPCFSRSIHSLQLRVRSPHFRNIRGVYITSSSADGALITPGLLCREMLQEYGPAAAVRIFLFSPVCRCGVAARLPCCVRVTLPMATTQDWRPDPHDEMGRSDVCSSRRALSGRVHVHLLSDVRAGGRGASREDTPAL